uniref:Uncharacterized protein n=1 Tax=Vibrio phage P018-4 TaxID=3229728 RepID=A0AB39AJE1_9CAUD
MNPLDKLAYLLTHSWSNTLAVIESIVTFTAVAIGLCLVLFWPFITAYLVDKFLESKRWKPVQSKVYDKFIPIIVTLFQIIWFCACIKTMYEYVL